MSGHVALRPLDAQHKQLLFCWRNDPCIVSRSSSAKPVSPDEHDDWFERLLASPDSLAYVIEVDGKPAGHLRLDKGAEGAATLTIYLVEEFTGAGLGTESIRIGCARARSIWPGIPVKAIVRPENLPMHRALGKAGFFLTGPHQGGLEFQWAGAEVDTAIERFSARLAEFGPTHSALDWGSSEGQQRRFELLASIGISGGASILDVGCGLGHLLDWLNHHGHKVKYTGMDVTPALLDVARARHPHAEFLLGDVLDADALAGRSFDFVVSSGLFYSYQIGGDAWMHAVLARMWPHATRGMAFNSLSAWAPEKDPGEFYADPCAVLSFCRQLSPWVDMMHSYHPRDFTVHVLRHVRP